MTNDKKVAVDKDLLRVALNKEAAHAYARMAERLKAVNIHVRVQPSVFVSFLVADYFNTYFEKDLDLLVSEFFDSQCYHETQLQRAKSEGNFECVMTETLATIRKIKSKTRRKTQGRKRQPNSAQSGE